MALAELPPGFDPIEELVPGRVRRVSRGGQELVLRWLGDPRALEAEVACSKAARHPSLVTPTQAGLHRGRAWCARPWVSGVTLDRALRGAGADPLAWTRDLLGALAALHDAGLVHRDVKAANVIVAPARAYLVDLDLVGPAGLAQSGVSGSLAHIAPEVWTTGVASAASDLFSLGAMLAFATLGGPPPEPVRAFPARAFWDAYGLDPAGLPECLAELVPRLVLRRPADRPASARAALDLLPATGEERPPALELPPLAGREDFARGLVGAREAGALVVAVSDAEELTPFATDLALAAAAAGERVVFVELAGDERPAPGERGGAELWVVRGSRGTSVETVLDLWQDHGGRRGPFLVLPADLAARVRGARASAGLEGPEARTRWEILPGVPAATLARALDAWTDHVAPQPCARLAADITARAGGRWARIAQCLREAPARGVLRAAGSSWIALREDWPAEAEASGPSAAAETLAGPARGLVRALLLLGGRARLETLVPVVPLAPDELTVALSDARAAGWLAGGIDAERRVAIAEERLASAPPRAPAGAGEEASGMLRRAIAELRRARAPLEQIARLELELAVEPDQRLAVLESADRLRRAGRLAAARALAEALSADASDPGRVAPRAVLLLARLDVAQSDPRGALRRLRSRFGAELAGEDGAARLVAAEAHLLLGEREQALALLERVLAGAPARALEVRARASLGYAELLGGHAQRALEHVASLPAADDPVEAAVAVLHLSSGALARLGRLDEALAALDAASRRADPALDPVLWGRTELNRAYVERRAGRVGRAMAAVERAATALARTDHLGMRALGANNAAALHRDRGELASAARELDRALAMRRRAGDRFGAASSLASRGLGELEAGAVGRARATLERALGELAAGEHATELGLVAAHRRLIDALLGLGAPVPWVPDAAHPGLELRIEAVGLLAAGREDAAVELLARRAPRVLAGLDAAEAFRLVSLWLAVDPRSADARSRLQDSAWHELGEVRVCEARWRLRDAAHSLPASTLRRWLELFEREGRIDLARAVGRALVAGLRPDEAAERRAVQARVEGAHEALTAGLEADLAERASALLDRLAAGGGGPLQSGLDLDWFLRTNRIMAEARDLDSLLARIVDLALEGTGARRGFLVLVEGEAVVASVARGVGEGSLADDELAFSSSVVQETLRTSSTVVTFDAGADERFAGMESVRALGLRSVLCVPLSGDLGTVGALYLDDDRVQTLFDARDVALVQALADQASIAVRQQCQRREIEDLNQRLKERVEFQARELERARERLRRSGERPVLGGLIGDSPPMQRLRAAIEALAATELAVLITGPSGSGKELVARALQQYSRRAAGPYVVENVAALPEALIESELFGHARGAFTGAGSDRRGLFVTASGGTFFLDEIGDLPMALQPKLLRVLEAGEVRPLGATQTVAVDVRIISATHKDLARQVELGQFRRDLYYRLNGGHLVVPSLRERVEDIPLLVAHFLERLSAELGRRVVLSDRVLARLMEREWVGEVRELSNEVTRLAYLCQGRIDDPDLVRASEATGPQRPASASTLEASEREAIRRALDACGGNKAEAARFLGISRSGLYTKLARLGLA